MIHEPITIFASVSERIESIKNDSTEGKANQIRDILWSVKFPST